MYCLSADNQHCITRHKKRLSILNYYLLCSWYVILILSTVVPSRRMATQHPAHTEKIYLYVLAGRDDVRE